MATSTRKEVADALLAAIAEDKELLRTLESIPGKVEKTVQELVPILTGETERSIEVKSRKTALKKLSTRRVRLGTVYSDEDPAKVNTIEYGRSAEDKHGATPEFAPFRKAAMLWNAESIE